MEKPLDLKSYSKGLAETEFLEKLKAMANKNVLYKNFIGMGYYGTNLPTVIQRNLLENPGWYTQYTPYQSEIAQGRLESLLNFQSVISDLTGMELSNSSLLDEGTAAAEAMGMALSIAKHKKTKFLISNKCHPQTIDNCETRAKGLGINVELVDERNIQFDKDVCGVLLQYPNTEGTVKDYSKIINDAKSQGITTIMSTDLLALTQLKPPGEYGVDIAVGSAQRFGVPMGYGGPHAAFLATSQQHKRLMPGRIIGVSRDTTGRPALRMAMQTREQHIRREKATSNICTAQALLANIAAMFAVYHGPEGLNKIALKANSLAKIF